MWILPGSRPAAITGSSEKGIQDAPSYIGSYRQMAPYLHLNYVTDTAAFAGKETALRNFSEFHKAEADSILPMGINNETLKYVADNHCIIYGHVGALSGWQTNGLYGGYKKLGKTAEDALKVYKTGL